MSNTETLLVPIDFSDCALALTQHAAVYALRLDAKVVLMHSIEAPQGLASDVLVKPAPDDEPVPIGTHMRIGAEARMPVYLQKLREQGVESSVRVVEGPPAESILEVAEEVGASMIIMGTHARRGIRRVLMGSVAESVVRQAQVPVLTIRNIHKPSCPAVNCGVCRSGITDEVMVAQAELDG
jgi:nucleotide-binding universal stress UspA family protein